MHEELKSIHRYMVKNKIMGVNIVNFFYLINFKIINYIVDFNFNYLLANKNITNSL